MPDQLTLFDLGPALPDDRPAGFRYEADLLSREEERVSVLGVPLPSGRKIKECLLELRC